MTTAQLLFNSVATTFPIDKICVDLLSLQCQTRYVNAYYIISRYEIFCSDSQDELVGVIEMPKTHSEAKKPQKHRFPFKKNREKVSHLEVPEQNVLIENFRKME